jgi:SAM-dependent methyltransferase
MDPTLWEEISAVEDRHWWFTARRSIILHLVSQLVPAGASVLDIGCGTGFTLEALAARFDAWGLEPDAAVRARTRTSVRDRVLPGDTRDRSALGSRRFDVVMLLDVLEHVEDDRAELSSAAAALAPGGKLVITVPANPGLWSDHDERNGHFRRYTDESLQSLLAEAGLTPSLLTHINSRLYPLARLHRKRASSSSAELRMPPAPVNALFRRLFAGERDHLDRGYSQGLSLLAVAQPTDGS